MHKKTFLYQCIHIESLVSKNHRNLFSLDVGRCNKRSLRPNVNAISSSPNLMLNYGMLCVLKLLSAQSDDN